MSQIQIVAVRDAIIAAELHDVSKQAGEIFTYTEPNVAVSRAAMSLIQQRVGQFPEIMKERIDDMLVVVEKTSRKETKFQFNLREMDGNQTPIELAVIYILDDAHVNWAIVHSLEEQVIKKRFGPCINVGKTGHQIQITSIESKTGKDEVNIGIISRKDNVTTITECGDFPRRNVTQHIMQGLIPDGKNIPISDFAEVMAEIRGLDVTTKTGKASAKKKLT